MAGISFELRKQTARFHNPLKEGKLDAQPIEVRLDPLTAHQSIFNPALEGKASILFPDTDHAYLLQRAEETKGQCFLCDGRWKTTTPRYDDAVIPGGRLIRGETVLFPNLFPLAGYHAVVMVGNDHHRTLDNFPASLLEDALTLSFEFVRRCYEADPEAAYFTINCNFLFPAGASVIHPHLQIIGSPFPGAHHSLLLEKSRAYYEKEGSCYWLDLIEKEKELDERVIGAIHDSEWFAAFSPIGINEVNAVWKDRMSFLEWTESDVKAFAEGLSGVLRAYHEMKFSTFNFSCFSGPLGKTTPEFRCFLRLINRQNVIQHYRTDDFYFQKLLKNEIIVNRPEALAKIMKNSLF